VLNIKQKGFKTALKKL